MSVIGPRPLLVEYLPYYTKEEHHRHDVRPGLSGWAQINGRNAIDSWEQRFQYDLEYVKNVSFAFDIMDGNRQLGGCFNCITRRTEKMYNFSCDLRSNYSLHTLPF